MPPPPPRPPPPGAPATATSLPPPPPLAMTPGAGDRDVAAAASDPSPRPEAVTNIACFRRPRPLPHRPRSPVTAPPAPPKPPPRRSSTISRLSLIRSPFDGFTRRSMTALSPTPTIAASRFAPNVATLRALRPTSVRTRGKRRHQNLVLASGERAHLDVVAEEWLTARVAHHAVHRSHARARNTRPDARSSRLRRGRST